MKVILFSRFPDDINKPRGGVETATIGLVLGLARISEIILHVVTLEKENRQLKIKEYDGFTVHRIPGTNWPMFLDLLFGPGKHRLGEYIKALSPDVVHFQETYGLGQSNIGIPSVFTVHGFDSLNLVAERQWQWRLRSKIWRLVECYGLGKQKHIVSITPYVNKEIEQRTPALIHDIENAISADYFTTERKEIRGRVFYAGWINPRKNVLNLVRAFAKIIKTDVTATLHLAGEINDREYAKKVENYIAEHCLENTVKLLGRITHRDVRQELSQASVFVLPSRQENAPMAIGEAMAIGVPIISSNVCGMPYMIDDAQTGYLIDPENVDQLADRLRLLLTDDKKRQEMSLKSKNIAKKRYHPDSVASKTVALYKRIIEE